ncbi:MAG: GDSL-type esterase/lipase family protein [Spirochaetales bacterium]
MENKKVIYPGYFQENVRADAFRGDFDCKNQVLIENNVAVDYVFFGDSITQMWELNAYFRGETGCIVNRGIGGDRTKYGAKRFEADALQFSPKCCIFMMGINDAWDLEFDHWKQLPGMSLQTIKEAATQNILQIITMAKAKGIALALCSILPTDMLFTNQEQVRKEYAVQLNIEIERLCKEHNCIYVDYHSALVDTDGLTVKAGLTIEGLHPNVFGYNIMANILRTRLATHGFTI